ncbi:hypothetical protein BY996DRAFT_7319258 [Phakopsora pachyrhizi]|uniref:F5/8 type C domain-containing protein n=1 Tax=Phakopsora pachyrhizi TaxID=170000 RepID=A0AAV0AD96_PHAPC|nr:hypothetical protein BY996DRAFT_7319258 [Phakopsora pachyrhizi]CAH7665965.1 hypothetical protein PPACK8108_LOCUS265 [Phakopsora pachyrhizi]
MSGQDILPDIRAKTLSRFRRRVLVFVPMFLTVYYIFWRGWKHLEPDLTDRLDLGSATRGSLEIFAPPKDLLQLVKKRQPAFYPHGPPLNVSAIIVLPSRDDLPKGNLQLVLLSIMRHSFVREIIIWNDDAMAAGADLRKKDLLSGLGLDVKIPGSFTPDIRIINSPGGMKEMSYHIACSLAKFNTCYFNDPNILNLNLNTLYSKFVESDSEVNLTIANQVSQDDFLAELPHEIHQSAHHLRTSIISRLSRGSFVPKQLSTRFFNQLSAASLPEPISNLYKSGISRYIAHDIQFSAWLNRQNIKLISSPESLIKIVEEDQKNTIDTNVIQFALKRLNETIQSYDPFLVPEIFPRPLPNSENNLGDEVGVVSASDDRSMLITNFDFSKDWNLLIDGDISTCWKGTLGSRKKTRYIGLNFVDHMVIQQIGLVGEFEPEDWELEFFLSDSNSWTSKHIAPVVLPSLDQESSKYVYHLAGQSIKIKKFRFMLTNKKYKQAIDDDELDEEEEEEEREFYRMHGYEDSKICGWVINNNLII